MEAIAALSLACNILQCADTGIKVVKTFKEVYQTGTTHANEVIASTTHDLLAATSKLQASLPQPATRNHAELQGLALHTAQVATELQRKISEITPNSSRRRDKFKKSAKAVWIKSDLVHLAEKLSSYREVLDTRILVDLRSRFDVTALNHEGSLRTLDETIRDFINQQASIQSAEHAATRRAIKDESRSIANQLQTIQLSTEQTREHDRLLSSLLFPALNARKNQINNAHYTTFEWIFGKHKRLLDIDDNIVTDELDLDSQENAEKIDFDQGSEDGRRARHVSKPVWDDFGDWLCTDEPLYWISGKAGSGKSTLTNFIFNHELTRELLGQWAAPQEVCLIEFYLWNAGSEMQWSLRGLLAGLLLQVVNAFPYISDLLVRDQPRLRRKLSIDDWSRQELRGALAYAIDSAKAKFFVLIDGLDEAQSTQFERQEELFQLVDELSSTKSVKCCVSSRPLKRYEDAFHQRPKLRLEDLNAEDMDRVFDDRLGPALKTSSLPDNKYLALQLRYAFQRQAQGVFLWAHLAIESLKQGLQDMDSWKTLLERFSLLPPEIEGMFEAMWKRNNITQPEDYGSQAALFLKHRLLKISDGELSMNLSLLHYTLCLPQNESLRQAAISGIIHKDLIEACRITQIHIHTRCAGILEVLPANEYSLSGLIPFPSTEVALNQLRQTDVQFTHRSARDFLITTPFGRSIIARAKWTNHELLRSRICAQVCEIAMSPSFLNYFYPSFLLRQIDVLYTSSNERDRLDLLQMIDKAFEDSVAARTALRGKPWFVHINYGTLVSSHYRFKLSLYERRSLDFVGFTIHKGYTALASHYFKSSYKVNPLYAQYCLLCWEYNKDLFIGETGWEANEHLMSDYGLLVTNLLQHSVHEYPAQTMFLRDMEVPRVNFSPKYVIRISVPIHICTAVWRHWRGGLQRDFKFCYDYLLLEHNLRQCLMVHFSLKWSKRRVLLRNVAEYPSPDDSDAHVVAECNISFIMQVLVEDYFEVDFPDIVENIRHKLKESRVEPQMKTLFTTSNSFSDFPVTVPSEEDSTQLIAYLCEALSGFWIRGGVTGLDSAVIEAIQVKLKEIRRHGRQVPINDFLRDAGWIIPVDDPAVMKEPPPMYLDDSEVEESTKPSQDLTYNNQSRVVRSTAHVLDIFSECSSGSDEEFFDAEVDL